MPKVTFAESTLNKQNGEMRIWKDPFTPNAETMLHIQPEDTIIFKCDNIQSPGNLTLTSASKYPITYKVQTTSPEKFRVRPRCGELNSGETITVSIVIKSEHKLSETGRDKFVVLATVLPSANMSMDEITAYWQTKSINDINVEQHRFVCAYAENDQDAAIDASANKEFRDAGSSGNLDALACAKSCGAQVGIEKQLAQIHNKHNEFDRKLKHIQRTQYLILLLIFLIALGIALCLRYYLSDINNTINSCDKSGGRPTISRWKKEI